MTPIPVFLPIAAGISLYIIGHQQGHIGHVRAGMAELNGTALALMSGIGLLAMLSVFGMVAFLWRNIGFIFAMKVLGLSILVQIACGIIVSSLHLLRYSWLISLSGIVLNPILIAVMVYGAMDVH
jgi:hypothetical protein